MAQVEQLSITEAIFLDTEPSSHQVKTKITTKLWGNPEWEKNPDVRLDPESIAKAYWYLAHQDRSAWTWELDMRPAHEKW